MMRGRPWQRIDPAFMWSLALFSIIAMQSMLWAHSIGRAAMGYFEFAKSIVLTILIVQLIRTPGDLMWYARLIFIGAVATIGLGLVNWHLGLGEDISVLGGSFLVRFKGAHLNANAAAAFMVSAIPLGVLVVRCSRSLVGRALGSLGVLSLVVGAFATYSRAAILSLVLVGVAVVLREVRSRKAYAVVFAVVALALLLTPGYYWTHIKTLTELTENLQQDWSLQIRVLALKESWELFKEYPLLGVGLYNFAARTSNDIYSPIQVHNMFMELLTGLGIIGLLAYMSMLISALRQCFLGMRDRWRTEHAWLRDFSYYLLIASLSTLVSGIFGNTEFYYLLWVPVAGALVLASVREKFADR
jgi:O-antigen ligase